MHNVDNVLHRTLATYALKKKFCMKYKKHFFSVCSEFFWNFFKVKLKSSMRMGDLIYDSCWHPTSDWLVTSSKDHPIHVWNSDGQWLATFRGINSLVSFRFR